MRWASNRRSSTLLIMLRLDIGLRFDESLAFNPSFLRSGVTCAILKHDCWLTCCRMEDIFDSRPHPLRVIVTVFNPTEMIFIPQVVDEDVDFATCLAVATSVHFLLGPLPLSLIGSLITLSCHYFRWQLSSGCQLVVNSPERGYKVKKFCRHPLNLVGVAIDSIGRVGEQRWSTETTYEISLVDGLNVSGHFDLVQRSSYAQAWYHRWRGCDRLQWIWRWPSWMSPVWSPDLGCCLSRSPRRSGWSPSHAAPVPVDRVGRRIHRQARCWSGQTD